MSVDFIGVLCRAGGVTIEVHTEPIADGEQVLIVERRPGADSHRVVGVMATVESARAEAELRVMRAGGVLGTRAAGLLGQVASRAAARHGAPLGRAPVCR